MILLAGSGLTGYYYGLNQAARIVSEKNGDSIDSSHDRAESKPDAGGITFYSALTEPKKKYSTCSSTSARGNKQDPG